MNVCDNQLTAITGLESLSSLRLLDVRDNKLESIAPVGTLRQLRTLDLAGNLLTAPPEGLLNLYRLRSVTVSENCMYDVDWSAYAGLPVQGIDRMLPR